MPKTFWNTLYLYIFRSGYDKRFWVLPCCFFDFYGKYERSNPSIGQYHDYLKYVKGVGLKCGYEMQTDVMRIPSTKRVNGVIDKQD